MMTFRKTAALLALAATLSGCASMPSVSRDAGFGKTFDPLGSIVLHGVYR